MSVIGTVGEHGRHDVILALPAVKILVDRHVLVRLDALRDGQNAVSDQIHALSGREAGVEHGVHGFADGRFLIGDAHVRVFLLERFNRPLPEGALGLVVADAQEAQGHLLLLGHGGNPGQREGESHKNRKQFLHKVASLVQIRSTGTCFLPSSSWRFIHWLPAKRSPVSISRSYRRSRMAFRSSA